MIKMKNTELQMHKVNKCTYLSIRSLTLCRIGDKYTHKSNIFVDISLTSVLNNNLPAQNLQSLYIFLGVRLRVNLQSS